VSLFVIGRRGSGGSECMGVVSVNPAFVHEVRMNNVLLLMIQRFNDVGRRGCVNQWGRVTASGVMRVYGSVAELTTRDAQMISNEYNRVIEMDEEQQLDYLTNLLVNVNVQKIADHVSGGKMVVMDFDVDKYLGYSEDDLKLIHRDCFVHLVAEEKEDTGLKEDERVHISMKGYRRLMTE